MDSLELIGLLLIGAVAWLWIDSLRARERAIAATKAACRSENLLLLDDTVAIARLGIGRNAEGRVNLRRVYDFEYSDTGNDRTSGSVVLLGDRVLVINLNLANIPDRAKLH
ncbi:MAG: DUF3301 domain-containing protein [Propionivibrio sp.]